MSEAIKHECGIALLRLRKPPSFYRKKYGEDCYGLNRMYVLMEKQHNRGQDGAGLFNLPKAAPENYRLLRDNTPDSLKGIFRKACAEIEKAGKDKAFQGELFLGHLRYGTFGTNTLRNIHPLLRKPSAGKPLLAMAGNFNITNLPERVSCDTRYVLNRIGEAFDRNPRDIAGAVRHTVENWDGGFVFCGLTGKGEAFVLRDPHGIRPAYYYVDEEVFVVASERPPIQAAFQARLEDIREVPAGGLLLCRANGETEALPCLKPASRLTPCSFEHIYFSQGTDADIYRERKQLGALLVPDILQSLRGNLKDTVFTAVPNTARVAFIGMRDALFDAALQQKVRPRMEQLIIKDAKMRVFITDDSERAHLAEPDYDLTYGQVRSGKDTVVLLDDSIVRGTTLQRNIPQILCGLMPKKLIVASCSPQFRYPDCYGIDMSRTGELIAFRAAVALLRESGRESVLESVYEACKKELKKSDKAITNPVREIYSAFTERRISEKIAAMLKGDTPSEVKVEVVFQSVENLHRACPGAGGDWYFTGNYPTAGGVRVACRSFVNYMENINTRAY